LRSCELVCHRQRIGADPRCDVCLRDPHQQVPRASLVGGRSMEQLWVLEDFLPAPAEAAGVRR
jgi:hypothetical protein